jgi:hypothetical protein
LKELEKPKSKGSKQKLSEKYKGKLPADVAEKMQKYVTKSRDEWERSI